MEGGVRIAAAALLFALGSWRFAAFATDTAFWKPYAVDDDATVLFHFDTTNLAAADGKSADVCFLGTPRFDPAGKFGGAMRLDGQGGLQVMPREAMKAGPIALEAWVRLEQYPAKDAYLIGIPWHQGEAGGIAFRITAQGALILETRRIRHGETARVTSPAGAVPTNTWIHLAAVCAADDFVSLYCNGRVVIRSADSYNAPRFDGTLHPTPVFIGCMPAVGEGLRGWLDDVRIHRNVHALWPQEDLAWASAAAARPLPEGPPYFLEAHAPLLHLPLDGNAAAVCNTNAIPGLRIKVPPAAPYRPGIRGEACGGVIEISAPRLLDQAEGTVEFWMQPRGVNNMSDRGVFFLNGGRIRLYFYYSSWVPKPMTLIVPQPGDARITLPDCNATEFHEGTWYHVVVIWKQGQVAFYINGRKAGGEGGGIGLTGPVTQLTFGSYGQSCADVDEVSLYRRALTPAEVANSYWRTRDPSKLVRAEWSPVEFRAQYFPSANRICYRILPDETDEAKLRGGIPGIEELRFELRNADGRRMFKAIIPFSRDEASLDICPLESGVYTLTLLAKDRGGRTYASQPLRIERQNFSWEGNQLGVTDEVYPPFTPLRVAHEAVDVVGRQYTMNAFGLWDQVRSLDRDLLTHPMTLLYRTATGEGVWRDGRGRWRTKRPNIAVYEAQIASESVRARTVSTVEVDGCMRVEMDLLPGDRPAAIERLWVDIPLKDREMPLANFFTDSAKVAYAGSAPSGTGVVWNGTQEPHWGGAHWLNPFVSYIWLGAEERGLAWFADNDRGWFTDHGGTNHPTQELVRENGTLSLRIYLVNIPTVITQATHLVFGLQVSPTKPMPADWRRKLPDIPAGLGVYPWGGLNCCCHAPYNDDWTIADKIIEARATGKVDPEWFEQYDRAHHPPLVFGSMTWLSTVLRWAERAARTGTNKALSVYCEEMYTWTLRDDWRTFQDEWTTESYLFNRIWPDDHVAVTYGPSYRDFGAYMVNQWLKRGASPYWDNTHPRVSSNFRTTDAYRLEDGRIQPCVTIWAQREYMKRVGTLLRQWQRKQHEPLEWILHMTNHPLLPLMTWGTASLDNEETFDEPFTPAWLRTESIGRQVGNYPLTCTPLYGIANKRVLALPPAVRGRIDWGMRMVHEIQRERDALENVVTGFGYGTTNVTVCNYWSGTPAIQTGNDKVKWIALLNPHTRSALVVLASWSPAEEMANVAVVPGNAGFPVAEQGIRDAETGSNLVDRVTAVVPVRLAAPYGVRILQMDAMSSAARLPPDDSHREETGRRE